jgi:hypothetical protein
MLGRGVKGFKHNNNLFDPAQYGHIDMSATLTFPLQVATSWKSLCFMSFCRYFVVFQFVLILVKKQQVSFQSWWVHSFFFFWFFFLATSFSSFLNKNDTGPLLFKKTRYLKDKLYFNLHSLGNF